MINCRRRLKDERWKSRHPVMELLRLYQKLHILVVEYDILFLILLTSTKVCLISFATFGVYGALRTTGFIAAFLFVAAVFSISFEIIYLMILGEVHSKSTAFLTAAHSQVGMEVGVTGIEGKAELLWRRKVLKSLPILKMRVKAAYFVDKPIVLTTVKILFDTIINFLLMTK